MSTPSSLSTIENALAADPRNAELHYLRGAELAQAGHYEQAVAAMARALELQPPLPIARFQLGLLHLTMGQPEEAVSVWQPLEQLKNEAALKHFKRGLEALIHDDFPQCIEWLGKGITLNSTNAPLNRDMELIINKAREALNPKAGTPLRTDFSLYERAPK
jgi:tetratricopeptide (TPR) repeat protein